MAALKLPLPPPTGGLKSFLEAGPFISGAVHRVWKLGQRLTADDLHEDEPEAEGPVNVGRRPSGSVRKGKAGEGGKLSTSLADLVDTGILAPGRDKLTCTYKGTTYVSSLAEDGAIEFEGKRYHSPTAWSIYVKRLITPDKQGDDGWKSVAYDGRALEHFRREHQALLRRKAENAAAHAGSPKPGPPASRPKPPRPPKSVLQRPAGEAGGEGRAAPAAAEGGGTDLASPAAGEAASAPQAKRPRKSGAPPTPAPPAGGGGEQPARVPEPAAAAEAAEPAGQRQEGGDERPAKRRRASANPRYVDGPDDSHGGAPAAAAKPRTAAKGTPAGGGTAAAGAKSAAKSGAKSAFGKSRQRSAAKPAAAPASEGGAPLLIDGQLVVEVPAGTEASGLVASDQWVQCDRCQTWRVVPNEWWATVQADDREVWYCEDAQWDVAAAPPGTAACKPTRRR